MFENTALVVVAVITATLLFRPAVRLSRTWRAIVTPLASVIGSGFLVAAPLLAHVAKSWALPAMAGIVLMAYAIGAVIRFNIRHAEPLLELAQERGLRFFERISGLALAIAYVISIAFYVRLLASFVLRAADVDSIFAANLITSAILIAIGVIGLRRGLGGLESLEEYAVNVKLSIIAALLLGFALFNIDWLAQGAEAAPARPVDDWSETLRLLAGMLLIVQGFETSRYLGRAYEPELRIRTMRSAQILAGIIYVSFVALALPLLADFHDQRDETAIIALSALVAGVLPAMLIVAATMSQFSAAVADTAGAGGLFAELTGRRFALGRAYLAVVTASVTLVWVSDIFEIITLASRAFAFYYLLQCLVALYASHGLETPLSRNLHRGFFCVMAGILLLIVLFAIPAE